MIDERVKTVAGVCLVGGGHVCAEVLAKALKFAPELIAADGGADVVFANGHEPRAVIGDFDSISDAANTQLSGIQRLMITEQETSDFEKSLMRIDAPFVVAVGFTGGRSDHMLSAMSVLSREVGPPTVIVDEHDVIFAHRGDLRLDLEAGTRVSLFPMAPVIGRSTGLHWPIDGIPLAPDGRVGTSNAATGPVEISFDSPGTLIILPAEHLGKVIDQLAD